MQGQPRQPSTMDVWSNRARTSWAPINCNMETLLHIVLQQHPLGSLTEFCNNSMVALQQHSPQGTTLTPHFLNHEDTESERKSRKISHLINRATSLQIPGTPKRSRHSCPCQDTDSHPARTGTSRRLELLNELVRGTSFTLTIYTIPYPQGHTGLRKSGNPSAAAPFILDKKDTIPVYSLMHQTFSDNLLQYHSAEALTESRNTLTDPGTDGTGTTLTLPPRPRKVWASGQGAGDAALKWQRVILIQDGKDKGFTQAPIRVGLESARTRGTEKYKGHVLEVLTEVSPTYSIGNNVHETLLKCFLQRSTVPAPDTLHYTLGEFPSNLVWSQERTPEHNLHLNAMTGRECPCPTKTNSTGLRRKTPPFLYFFLSQTRAERHHPNPPRTCPTQASHGEIKT